MLKESPGLASALWFSGAVVGPPDFPLKIKPSGARKPLVKHFTLLLNLSINPEFFKVNP